MPQLRIVQNRGRSLARQRGPRRLAALIEKLGHRRDNLRRRKRLRHKHAVELFGRDPGIADVAQTVLMFDAAGLALFAVSGTHKALGFGLNPVMAALLGMLTGIGGGIVRAILVNENPTVLKADIYALAALAGAAVVVIGSALTIPATAATAAGALFCFGCVLWLFVAAGGCRSQSRRQKQIATERSDSSVTNVVYWHLGDLAHVRCHVGFRGQDRHRAPDGGAH